MVKALEAADWITLRQMVWRSYRVGRPGLALALMDRPEVSRFRDMWLAIPAR